jgi:hypothetical protein
VDLAGATRDAMLSVRPSEGEEFLCRGLQVCIGVPTFSGVLHSSSRPRLSPPLPLSPSVPPQVYEAMTWDPDKDASAFTPLGPTPAQTPPVRSPAPGLSRTSSFGGAALGGAQAAPLAANGDLRTSRVRQWSCSVLAAPGLPIPFPS